MGGQREVERGADEVDKKPIFWRVPASCWSRWAARLEDVKSTGKLQTTADLEHVGLPPRSPFIADPVIARVIDDRHDSRHPDYYRTIASWPRYGMRPMSEERARALYAWSAAVFFLDDLVDGWNIDPSELELASLVEAQRVLIHAVGRRGVPRPAVAPTALPFVEETARAVRRASDLCFALRPSDAWWEDYQREMTVFVHGRLVTLYMAKCKVWLPPELYLRARVFDIGGNTASVMAGLSRGEYPSWSLEVSREVAILQALSWLHMTAVNDLYSYHRERDETLFNALHSVQATASRRRPTSLRQAVDCVVRFTNDTWLEFVLRSTLLIRSAEGRASRGLRPYLDELLVNMMGNLDFVREEGTRYRSPSDLEGDSRAVRDAGHLHGHRQWTDRGWDGMDVMLASDPIGRSCSEFVLAGVRAA